MHDSFGLRFRECVSEREGEREGWGEWRGKEGGEEAGGREYLGGGGRNRWAGGG